MSTIKAPDKIQESQHMDQGENHDIKKKYPDDPTPNEDETQYPKNVAAVVIMLSVLLALFLVALDRTIIATAIPHITDEFHSLDDVGWYASSYMLTASSMTLLYGRIYKFYSTKNVFLSTICLFEIGSLICGVSPSSIAFIIGRAIAGFGSAGIFSGGMMVMLHTIPLHKRPMYSGLFAATFGIASAVGPLLGGAFTDRLTWRWCFYINLPVGGVAIAIIFFALKLPAPKDAHLTLRQQMGQLDPLGATVFLPAIISLILALQWGGTTYAWNSGRVIGLFVVFGVLIIIFIAIQIWKGDTATVPPRIVKQRSIAFGAYFMLCTAGSMMLIIYYVPIWFQAVKGTTAVESGIRVLPIVLSLVVASVISGVCTMKIGYYVPAMICSPIVASVGAGMLTTLRPNTGHSEWIGYQVIYGFGLGLAMQTAGLAAQAVLAKSDVAIGTAIIFFAQQLGGSIFVSVGQNVFINSLVSGVSKIPGLETKMILNIGATDLQKNVPAQYLDNVLEAYNHALTRPFVIATAMTALSVIGALGMEWKNIKKNKNKGGGQPVKVEEVEKE